MRVAPKERAKSNFFGNNNRIGELRVIKYNKNLRQYSKELRNNMTKHEKRLWYDFLKKLPFNVKRQQIIGNYIVDFFIPAKNVVIEIDGVQHTMEKNESSDIKRDEYLLSMGITVLRYSNESIVNDFIRVCDDILNCLDVSVNDLI